MANRYWNPSGAANWNTANVWALTDGGTADQATPTSADAVFFTSTNVNNCTSVSSTSCLSINCTGGTGYTGTLACGSNSFYAYGSFTLSAGMTFTSSSTVYLMSTSADQTFTLGATRNGVSVNFFGTGGYILQDAFNIGTGVLTHTKGTLNANNQNVTCASFGSNNANTRVLTMGSGTWTVTGTETVWDITDKTNLTVSANTSTIKLTNNSATAKTFIGGGITTYNNFWIATGSTGITTISGSNTFVDLKIAAGQSVKFTDGTDQTVTSLTWVGTVGNLITLNGTSTAGWKVSDTTGTNSVDYCDIHYSTAEGGATFDADVARGNVNGGNNSGWTFNEAAAGPVNLKSLNTNLAANIKSYNTNLIANVKSINTNV